MKASHKTHEWIKSWQICLREGQLYFIRNDRLCDISFLNTTKTQMLMSEMRRDKDFLRELEKNGIDSPYEQLNYWLSDIVKESCDDRS